MKHLWHIWNLFAFELWLLGLPHNLHGNPSRFTLGAAKVSPHTYLLCTPSVN